MTDKDQSSAAGQHGHSTSRGLAIKRVASPSDNLVEMLSLIRVRDRHVSRTQRVANLNILAKKVRETPPDNESDIEQVVYSVRWSLCSKVQEVRAGGLRVLRYLLINNTSFNLFMKYHLDKLVVRCLDSSSQHETERIQALRLMRQVLHVAVERFPRSFAASLVSISAQTNNSHDPLVWASVGTLCELALVNPKLAAQSGVVKVLLRMLLTCQVARINEAIVTTMLCLVNHPDTRQYMYAHLDIESVMAPITDLHYQFEAVELDMKKSLEDRETHVEASKVALTAMLKSWSGLIYLSQSGVIRTLLEVLPLADPFVQKALLEVFFDVFQIRIPEWTECFIQVLKSVETSQFSHDWMLDEGWIAEEGMYLLPPRITSRTNLVISYLSMLLVTLIKCGLSKAFTKLYERCYKSMEQQRVAVRATVLIGELIHFSSSYIPVELSHRVHCVPDLIASATQFTNHARRSLASQVVSCLDRVHQLKKKSAKPSSLFLDLILKQTGYHKKTTHYDFSQFVSQDFDDAVLLNIIRDTQVIHTKDYSKWNLDLVISLLQSPALQFSRLDDTYGIKFIKRLTNFFKPSNYIFTSISYNTQNMKTFSTIGCSLVNFLTKTTEGTQRFLIDLIADIVSQLSQVTAHKKTADVFTPQCIQNTLCRDYFLFIGYVSYQKPAVLLACNAYAPLLAICDIPNRNDLIKLIISSLDYGHDVYSRVILNKVLTASDQAMRLYATKHLGVLLRAKMQFFNNWGIQMLVTQLYDVDEEVAMKAVDILDEACEEESCLIALIIHRPALLHLAEKGVSLLTRFISTSRGFTLMKELGYLDSELLRWFTNYNEVYVQLVERRLAEAFTSYKCAQEGSYVRRSAIKSCRKAEVFVPIHFYGQLIQQRSGCELLKKKDHVKIFADIIRRRVTSSTNVLNTKAILWALGHIGSSGLGLDLLIAADIISEIVVMATSNPVFSIRGTCFYTLCLIAKTTKGVQQLKQLGWVSVCHSHEHKWPVVTNKNIKMTTPPLKKERSIVQQKSLPEVVLSEESPDIMAMKRRAMLKKSSSTMASAIPQKITEGKVFEDVSDVMATSQRTKGEFPRSRANNMSPQQRPISMISLSSLEGEMTSPPSGTDKPMTIGSSHKTSSTGSYLGLCVPLEYDTMYK
ncbi:rapamycin-insensitive companion of mTOR-like isoform X3 [Dysidea avara]